MTKKISCKVIKSIPLNAAESLMTSAAAHNLYNPFLYFDTFSHKHETVTYTKKMETINDFPKTYPAVCRIDFFA